MHHTIKTLAITSTLAISLIQTRADQTNLVQQVNIQFAGIKQGQTTKKGDLATTGVDGVSVNTKQVIAALGTALGRTFSGSADLVLITPLGASYRNFAIRDGRDSVDVTGFFLYEQDGPDITHSVANLKSGRISGSDFSVQRLALLDAWVPLGLHFDFRGIATASFGTTAAAGSFYDSVEVEGTAAGDRSGSPVILQGTIRIKGQKFEVVASGGTS